MANLHARIFAIFVKNGILLTPNSRPLIKKCEAQTHGFNRGISEP